MENYESRISALRGFMRAKGLKSVLILTGDPFASETPSPHYAFVRDYYCPFRGDNASVLIGLDQAYLWCDGRFFISAKKQLEGSPFKMMKMDTEGYPSLYEFLSSHPDYFPLGGMEDCIPESDFERLSSLGKIEDVDLIGLSEGVPEKSHSKLFMLGSDLVSEGAKEKIARFKEKIGEGKAAIVTTLDDIAYLTNLRGDDIPYTPLFDSYLYLGEEDVLFVDESRIPDGYSATKVMPIESVFDYLRAHGETPTYVDRNSCNSKIYSCLANPLHGTMPSNLEKAIKRQVEIENTIRVQKEDGAALVRFQMLLESGLPSDELALSDRLHEFRRMGKGFIGESFQTICSASSNAAMMHYAPTSESHSAVSSDDVCLLVDSGGQYLGGTTDTTRTFPINPTEEFRRDYTLTLKSLIAISKAVFLSSCTGRALDGLSREIMWREGMDYKCGTGHGVGYMGVVHEGPNGFRYKDVPGKNDGCAIVPGMITTIEPGVYKEGKYGIRIENNLLCVMALQNEFGRFYRFKTITYAPIETSCVEKGMLDASEIEWLNDYHKQVYEALSPLLNDEEKAFLKKKTQAI